jgi:hypothetical protein
MIGHGERCSDGWLCSECKGKSQAAEQERTRIIDLINGRMSIHNEFINDCVKHDVRVSDSFFIALSELRSILREIER